MSCPVCMEEFDCDNRIKTKCARCSEWVCTECFIKVIKVCPNACHIMYKCPVCNMEVNLSVDFLNIMFGKMKNIDVMNLRGITNNDPVLRATKDKETGEIKWTRRVIKYKCNPVSDHT